MRSLLLLAGLLAACAGPAADKKHAIARLQAAGDFGRAADRVLAMKDDYGTANAALFHLDAAQALADAGRRREADGHFSLAQDRMQMLWTLSAAKLAGSALGNENVDDYRGEDFERALSHVLRALNLIAMDRRAEALIEAKRVEAYLDELARATPRKRSYRDDAFARWMAAALYEDLAQADDARISARAAADAYRSYGRVYGAQAPSEPEGLGESEVVFVHLDGAGPRKIRREGGGALSLLLKTSYPVYEDAGSRIFSVEASIEGSSQRAVIVENLTAIAVKDLEERLALLQVRSALRSAVKLAGTAIGVRSQDSEFADVRGWGTMPARIRVARLRSQSGPGRLVVRYLDSAGREIAAKEIAYSARPGARAWVIDRTAF